MNEATSGEGSHESGFGMLLAIAVFKLVKAVLLVALGIAAFSLARDGQVLTTMRHVMAALGFSAHGDFVDRAFGQISGIDHRRLRELGVGTFVYAAVFLVEGTGLILRKRWAEYLTSIVTASFIPLEIYEMVHKASVFKALGIAVNVAVVAYLVVRLWQRRHSSP